MQTLSVPCDFRIQTVEEYARLNARFPHLRVVETYGNLNPSPLELGSGRVAKRLPAATLAELRDYVQAARALHIGHNYTLNSPCTRNLEFTTRGRKALLGFIATLLEMGIERFTLSSPSLIQLVKGHFPEAHITASTIAEVDSLFGARIFQDMGADRIVLNEDILRRFDLLDALRTESDISLEAVVNTRCLFLCPFKPFDYSFLSHCQNDHQFPQVSDYYKWHCTHVLFTHPLEWLKMRWIRPEDLPLYRDIHVFKIIGRQLVDDSDLPRTVQTYMKGRFEGNLIELLGNFSPTRTRFYPIYMDNRALDGFVEWFARRPVRCREASCDGCKHCRDYAGAIRSETLENLKPRDSSFQMMLDHFHHDLRTLTIGPEQILLAGSGHP